MTKRILTIIVALTISAGLYLSCSNSAANGPAQTDPSTFGEVVSINTVHAIKGKKDVIILDVREPSEYDEEHIPGVIHIPMGEALQRKSEFLSYKVVIITCRSGNRSGQITTALRAQGHSHVHNMAGGIRAWKSAGFPVTKAK